MISGADRVGLSSVKASVFGLTTAISPLAVVNYYDASKVAISATYTATLHFEGIPAVANVSLVELASYSMTDLSVAAVANATCTSTTSCNAAITKNGVYFLRNRAAAAANSTNSTNGTGSGSGGNNGYII